MMVVVVVMKTMMYCLCPSCLLQGTTRWALQEGRGAELVLGPDHPAAAEQSHSPGLLLRQSLEEGRPVEEAQRQPGGGQGQPAEEPAAHCHVSG